MILHGNQRGGARNLALHLLKDENEHVDVHDLRGFVAEDLVSALEEARAIARGTKAKQFLFSLSVNPPPSENVPTAVFEDAIRRAEEKLGLTDQPRAIVFHEKEGRRHCHAVWSRIKTDTMTAVQLSHSKRKLMEVSRALFLEHGWELPAGLRNTKERDPRNFTLAEWQQAKRIGKNPKDIKAAFQEGWAESKTQAEFVDALQRRGYVLARGDRRGFVALDHCCEVFSVSKWVGVKAKDLKTRLKEPDALPSVTDARTRVALEMGAHLAQLQERQGQQIQERLNEIETKRIEMTKHHRAERQKQKEEQRTRWTAETAARQARLSKGLRGLLDRVTGRHAEIKRQNELDAWQAVQRDQRERDRLIFQQLDARRALSARKERLKDFSERTHRSLVRDLDQYDAIRSARQERFEHPQSDKDRHNDRGPTLER